MIGEPVRRVRRFKHVKSVQQYRREFGVNFVNHLRTKSAETGVKLVYDVHVMGVRIGLNFGLTC